MLISRTKINRKIGLCLLFLILLSVFTPFNKTFAANLIAENVQETSALLKATGLTPGKNVMLWVYSKDSDPVTPFYAKSHPFTVNNAGQAFFTFADLSPHGVYRAEVTSSTGTDASLGEFKTLKRSAKNITSFTASSGIIPITGVINDLLGTISLTAPFGANVTALTPTIVVSDKATVSPASLVPQDFTSPVIYTVTAEDGSTWNYTVTVVFGPAPIPITSGPPPPNPDTTYTPLVSLPGLPNNVPFETDKTKNPCPFGKYLNILIKIFLGIAAVLAMVMIVVGGVEYMTSELASSKEEGKKSITNAVLGLLLALGAYMILNTINPDLLNVCLNNVHTVDIVISPDQIVSDTPPPAGGKICNGEYKMGDAWPADYDTRAQLASQKIDVKLPSCSNGKVGDSCTSVYKLDTTGVIGLKQNCDKYVGSSCEFTISGGTECWMHGSNPAKVHMPGGSSVDLRESASLKKYITQDGKNAPSQVKWIGGAYYPAYAIGTLKVVDETTNNTSHYHVVSY
jgi:hypothetical protein